MLQGHPTKKTPGVDVSTGSLGQGLSIANGIALAGRLDGKSYRSFAILGDGECDEGQIWEAAMTAGHLGLSNVTAIIDRNGMQSDDATERVKKKEPLDRKWRTFGWQVLEIDGHNLMQIHHSFDVAEWTTDRPTVIIADSEGQRPIVLGRRRKLSQHRLQQGGPRMGYGRTAGHY